MAKYTWPANIAMAGAKVVADYFTHFLGVPADLTLVKTNSSGAITVADMAGGGYGALTTGGTSPADNNGAYLVTQGEIFKFDSTSSFRLFSQLKFTPSGSNTDNVMAIGVMNAPTENTFLGDNGAGPPADYWGACIYKVDGGTTWLCEVSYGTTQKTLDTEIAVTGTETTFEIEYMPTDSGRGEVAFRINGELVRVPGTYARDYFKPEFPLALATEMAALVGHKTGAASELVSYINAFGFAIGLAN